jgi:hypothetical protein
MPVGTLKQGTACAREKEIAYAGGITAGKTPGEEAMLDERGNVRKGAAGLGFCGIGRQRKKEEFPGVTKTCRLGTPFPRSALFLLTTMLKNIARRNSTLGVGIKVTAKIYLLVNISKCITSFANKRSSRTGFSMESSIRGEGSNGGWLGYVSGKKGEFSCDMILMTQGNSLPQICVVSCTTFCGNLINKAS